MKKQKFLTKRCSICDAVYNEAVYNGEKEDDEDTDVLAPFCNDLCSDCDESVRDTIDPVRQEEQDEEDDGSEEEPIYDVFLEDYEKELDKFRK